MTAFMLRRTWAGYISHRIPGGAEARLHQLAAEEYGVIYITEALAAELKHEIARYQDQIIPAIIEIPGVSGNTGNGVRGVKKSVEQAVGSDILFSN